MQVVIYESGTAEDLTNSGWTLQRRAHIGDVATNGSGHLGAMPFERFSQNHPNGITVQDKDSVVLIVGGRKSILAALTNHPLLLIPTLGQSLAMRVIRANGAGVPAPVRFCHAMDAPGYAIKHAKRADGNFFKKLAAGAKHFAAIHEAIDETSKMFTYIQLYSGQAEAGDYVVAGGNGAVTTPALAVQLQTLAGWSK
jgi:hypothetical protein